MASPIPTSDPDPKTAPKKSNPVPYLRAPLSRTITAEKHGNHAPPAPHLRGRTPRSLVSVAVPAGERAFSLFPRVQRLPGRGEKGLAGCVPRVASSYCIPSVAGLGCVALPLAYATVRRQGNTSERGREKGGLGRYGKGGREREKRERTVAKVRCIFGDQFWEVNGVVN